jgi:hypothetical protein
MFIMTRRAAQVEAAAGQDVRGSLRAGAAVTRRVGRARHVQQGADRAVLLGELGLQQVRALDLAQRRGGQALHDDDCAAHVARLLVVLLVEAVADVDQPGLEAARGRVRRQREPGHVQGAPLAAPPGRVEREGRVGDAGHARADGDDALGRGRRADALVPGP